ncbi:MAG: hypothetical protein JW874_01050 [Spirochaetales bacterium]|nr:hypothetical protein [Spirochaetales bacterium]
MELLKAQALLQYWTRQQEIADAVCTYAEDDSSDKPTAEETQTALSLRRGEYNGAVDAYTDALVLLNGLLGQVDIAQGNITTAREALTQAEADLEQAKKEYQDALDAMLVSNADFYKRMLRSNYRELLREMGFDYDAEGQPEEGESGTEENTGPTEAALYGEYLLAAKPYLQGTLVSEAARTLEKQIFGQATNGYMSLSDLKDKVAEFDGWSMPATADDTFMQSFEFLNDVDSLNLFTYYNLIQSVYTEYSEEDAKADADKDKDVILLCRQKILNFMMVARQQAQAQLDQRIAAITLLASGDFGDWLESFGLDVSETASLEAYGAELDGLSDAADTAYIKDRVLSELAIAQRVKEMLDTDSVEFEYTSFNVSTISDFNLLPAAVRVDLAAYDYIISTSGYGGANQDAVLEALGETIGGIIDSLSAISTYLAGMEGTLKDNSAEIKELSADDYYWKQILNGNSLLDNTGAGLAELFAGGLHAEKDRLNAVGQTISSFAAVSPVLKQYIHDRNMQTYEDALVEYGLGTVETAEDEDGDTVTTFAFASASSIWTSQFAGIAQNSITQEQVEEIYAWYSEVSGKLTDGAKGLEYLDVQTARYLKTLSEFLALQINRRQNDAAQVDPDAYNGTLSSLQDEHEEVMDLMVTLQNGMNPDLRALCGLYEFDQAHGGWSDISTAADLRAALISEAGIKLAGKILQDPDFADITEDQYCKTLFDDYELYEFDYSAIEAAILAEAQGLVEKAVALHDPEAAFDEGYGYWPGLYEEAFLNTNKFPSFVAMAAMNAAPYYGLELVWREQATMDEADDGLSPEELTALETSLRAALDGKMEEEQIDDMVFALLDVITTAEETTGGQATRQAALLTHLQEQGEALLADDELFTHVSGETRTVYEQVIYLGLCKGLSEYTANDDEANDVAVFIMDCLGGTSFGASWDYFAGLAEEDEWDYIWSLDERAYVHYLENRIMAGNDIGDALDGLSSAADRTRLEELLGQKELLDGYISYFDGTWIDYLLENYEYTSPGQLTRAIALNSSGGISFFTPGLEIETGAALDVLQYDCNPGAFRTLCLEQLVTRSEALQDDMDNMTGYSSVYADQARFYEMEEDGYQSYRSVLGGSNPDENSTEPPGYMQLGTYCDADYDYDNTSDALAAGTLAADAENIAHTEGGGWYDDMLLERFNELNTNAGLLAVAKTGAEAEDYSDVFDDYYTQTSDLKTLINPLSGLWEDDNLAAYQGTLDALVQSILSEDFNDIRNAYTTTQKEWNKKIATIQNLKSAITDLGTMIEYSMLDDETLTANVAEKYLQVYGSGDGETAGCKELYEDALAAWQTAINTYTQLIDRQADVDLDTELTEEQMAAMGYNQLQEYTSGLYEIMNERRLEFEKADAIYAYASSGYLLNPSEDQDSDGSGTVDATGDEPPSVDPAGRKAYVDGELAKAQAIYDALFGLFTDGEDADSYEGPAPLYSTENDTDDPLVLTYRQNYDTYREYYLRTLVLQEIRSVASEALTKQEIVVTEAAADAIKEISKLIKPADEDAGETLPVYEYSGTIFADDENYDSRWYWMLDLQTYISENHYDSVNELLISFGKVYCHEQAEADKPWYKGDWMSRIVGQYPSAFPNTDWFHDDEALKKYRARADGLVAAEATTFYAKCETDSNLQKLYQYFKECQDMGLVSLENDNSNLTFINAAIADQLQKEIKSDIAAYQADCKTARNIAIGVAAASAILAPFFPWALLTYYGALATIAETTSFINTGNIAKGEIDKLNINSNVGASESYFISQHKLSVEAILKYQQECKTLEDLKTGGATGNVTLAGLADSITTAFDVVERSDDLDSLMEKASGKDGREGLMSFLKTCYADLANTEAAAVNESAETKYTNTDDLLSNIYGKTDAISSEAYTAYASSEQAMKENYDNLYARYTEARSAVLNSDTPTEEELAELRETADQLFSMSYTPNQAAILRYELIAGVSDKLGLENLDNQSEVLKNLISAQWTALLQMNTHKNSQFAKVRNYEFGLIATDYEEKMKQWNEKVSTIMWRGRTAWRKAQEEMELRSQEWVDDFISNYRDKQEEWDLRYLDILTAKDAWVAEVSIKASQIGSARVLNDVGMSADMAIAGVDSFIITDVDAEKVVAKNIFESVIDMDMMNGLITALEDSNGIIDTVQTKIFANMRIESEASVLQNIAAYTARSREEIEKHTLIMMAEKALDSVELAEEGLRMQVEAANRNFDRQMDSMFLSAGFNEIASGMMYEKTIVVGDTVFGGTEYETCTVPQYVPFALDNSYFWQDTVTSETFNGMSARAIEAYVDQVSRFYQGKMKAVFNDDIDKTATDRRMENFINSINGQKVKQTEDGKWMFLRPEKPIMEVVGFLSGMNFENRKMNNDGIFFHADPNENNTDYAAMIQAYMDQVDAHESSFWEGLGEGFTQSSSDYYIDVLNYLFVDENGETLLAGDGMNVKLGTFFNYIGYAPRFYDNATCEKSMKDNTMIEGYGELNTLITDFQEVILKEQKGLAELNAAFWAKPLWDASALGVDPAWDFLVEPSIQDVVNIGFMVIGMVLTGDPMIAACIGLIDDAFFSTMNVAFGHNTFEEELEDFGTTAAVSLLTAGMAKEAQEAVKAAEAAGKTIGTMERIANGFGQQVASNALSGFLSSFEIDYTAMIEDLFDGDGKFGEDTSYVHFDSDQFFNSIFGGMAITGYLASAAQTGMTDLMNGSLFNDERKELLSVFKDLDSDAISSLSKFIGGITGEAVRFALSGEACFNILNLMDILNVFGVGDMKGRDGNDLAMGLVEMRISNTNGLSLALGSGGADISISSLANIFTAIEQLKKIDDKFDEAQAEIQEGEKEKDENTGTDSTSSTGDNDENVSDNTTDTGDLDELVDGSGMADTVPEDKPVPRDEEKKIAPPEDKPVPRDEEKKIAPPEDPIIAAAMSDFFKNGDRDMNNDGDVKDLENVIKAIIGEEDFNTLINFLKEYYPEDQDVVYSLQAHMAEYIKKDSSLSKNDLLNMVKDIREVIAIAKDFDYAVGYAIFVLTPEQMQEDIKTQTGVVGECSKKLIDLMDRKIITDNRAYNPFDQNVAQNLENQRYIDDHMHKSDEGFFAYVRVFSHDGESYFIDTRNPIKNSDGTTSFNIYKIDSQCIAYDKNEVLKEIDATKVKSGEGLELVGTSQDKIFRFENPNATAKKKWWIGLQIPGGALGKINSVAQYLSFDDIQGARAASQEMEILIGQMRDGIPEHGNGPLPDQMNLNDIINIPDIASITDELTRRGFYNNGGALTETWNKVMRVYNSNSFMGLMALSYMDKSAYGYTNCNTAESAKILIHLGYRWNGVMPEGGDALKKSVIHYDWNISKNSNRVTRVNLALAIVYAKGSGYAWGMRPEEFGFGGIGHDSQVMGTAGGYEKVPENWSLRDVEIFFNNIGQETDPYAPLSSAWGKYRSTPEKWEEFNKQVGFFILSPNPYYFH